MGNSMTIEGEVSGRGVGERGAGGVARECAGQWNTVPRGGETRRRGKARGKKSACVRFRGYLYVLEL